MAREPSERLCRTRLLTMTVGAVKINAERTIKTILITPHFVRYRKIRKKGRCMVSGIIFSYTAAPTCCRSTWLRTDRSRIRSGVSHFCTRVRSRKWISIRIHSSAQTNSSTKAGE